MKCRLFTTTARRRAAIAAAVLWASAATAAIEVPRADDAGTITAVPPATARGGAPQNRSALLAPHAPVRRIELAAPDGGETASMRSYNADTTPGRDGKGRPLAIGFGRELPAASRSIALSTLAWIAAADGGRTARVEIASPGAAALRVALALSDPAFAISFRFAGAVAIDAFGAYSARRVADDAGDGGQFWSPVLAGDVAIVELHAAAGAAIDDIVLSVPRISHLLAAGADLRSLPPAVMKASGIGAAGACNIDIACVTPANAAAQKLTKSVAKLQFVGDDGRAYLCTGTLLNDSIQSQTPYLLSASHCIGSAAIARTLNTFWFYDAVACNSTAQPQYVQLSGGAQLLGRSPDHDWSIVRLLDVPPTGTMFAAWRAEPLANGIVVASLHHPEGDLVKWSKGTVTGSLFIDDGFVFGSFDEVVWNQGVTEAGSSGGALLTLASDGSYYEVRGGLYAGISSCALPAYPDYFSRLETALPVMRSYLTPNAANPSGKVVATEFYNRQLDHYFLSTNPFEIANLDSGTTVGWVRTGLRFVVYDNPAPGTSPVCRFYRAPAYGDSHFYSASPEECAATAAAHPVDWVYESANVFYVQRPNATTGACAAGTQPVYRYFNTRTTNHRYTTEVVVRNGMDASYEWTAEGYGPGPYLPIMCAAAQ
ncbi:MAG: trypsin-like peptidase domain-containing protein [Betaproteobacteria bacterium]